jgi:ElaB/YqjD/DUF883 family membrane-anchored ribosome-binding protein
MFQRRSSAAAIQGHLRAIEKELERLGRSAGRHASIRASALGGQIADTATSVLNETADRLRTGQRLAVDEGTRIGDEALKIGRELSNDALDRIGMEVEHRPFIALALALGVGILIGIAGSRRLETSENR